MWMWRLRLIAHAYDTGGQTPNQRARASGAVSGTTDKTDVLTMGAFACVHVCFALWSAGVAACLGDRRL